MSDLERFYPICKAMISVKWLRCSGSGCFVGDVAAGDQRSDNADAEDYGSDSVDKGYKGRSWTRSNLRERKHNIVHYDINHDAIKPTPKERMTREREVPAGNDVNGGDCRRDEKVEEKANECGVHTLSKGDAAQDSDGDTLKDTNGSDTAKGVKDQSVGEIQSTRDQARERNGLEILGARRSLDCHEDSIVALIVLFGNPGVGFNLNSPLWVEKRRDDDHRGGRPDEAKEFAMNAAGGLPVFDLGEVHTSAVDVLERASGVFQSGSDEGKALICLQGHVAIVSANRPGTGDVDLIPDTYCSRETDNWFEGRCAWDVFACHELSDSFLDT
jgi:hypothetical protein